MIYLVTPNIPFKNKGKIFKQIKILDNGALRFNYHG